MASAHGKGKWNASTNIPNLTDATGVFGDFYIITTNGLPTVQRDLGSGMKTFLRGETIVKTLAGVYDPYPVQYVASVDEIVGHDGTGGGMINPMSALGDMIYGDIDGAPLPLTIGLANQVLTVVGGIPQWVTPMSTSGVTSVSGTAHRVIVSAGLTPVVDIAADYVGQTSITTLGTIVVGTWHAGTIDADHGGTGQTVYAVGDLLYANAINSLARLGISTDGKVLTLSGGLPTWQLAAATGVTSIDITPGTGISATGGPITTSGSITVTNTLPDQTVVLNDGAGVAVTGTYPNFTITNTAPSTGGTVISVSGTSDRISVTSGTTTPVIDIASIYAGQDSIVHVGILTSGTWHSDPIDLAAYVSGNLAVSHLNSGSSASSGTFWRGDGTWSPPPGTTYTGTPPIDVTGSVISISLATSGTNGYLSSSDWLYFAAKQAVLSGTGIVKSAAGTISYISGLSSQFVKGDGSLDSNQYLTSGATGIFIPYSGAILDVNIGSHSIRSTAFITSGGTSSLFVKGDGTLDNGQYLTSGSTGVFIPYSGAIANVFLGIRTITATSFITSGGTSSQFVKGDGSLDSNTYLTTSGATGYVPYTGATSNINLGAHAISGTTASFTTVNINYPTSTTGILNVNGQLLLVMNGVTPISLSNAVVDTENTVNSYLQHNTRNASSGASASTDYIATADTGSDTTNYIDVGINSSGFSDGTWTINGATDGYLYTQSSHLAIGTAASKNLVLFTGGTLATNARLTIDSSGTSAFSGAVNETKVTFVASPTMNIGAALGNFIDVSGTSTITAFDTVQAGTERTLRFITVGTVITHGAGTIILPGGANITTLGGDTAIFRSDGAGAWKCISFLKPIGWTGTAGSNVLSVSPAFTGTPTFVNITATNTVILGSATTTNSISLGNGVTASGSTKTVNVGTAGASGSTTAINIGSATAGSTNNITISLGSDATGDIWYRASSGFMTRLGVGNSSQYLQGGTVPAWCTSGSVVIVTDTQTLTNKRITKRTGTTTSSATPTINTDNVDFYSITALSVDITSMTTNLSGTPTENQTLWLAITGTATRAITWGTSFESSTILLPTATVSTSRLDVGLTWNTVTSKWRCVAAA